MMKDLLLFARPPKPRRSPTDIVPLVETTVSLLSRDPSLQDVDIDVEGSAPPVHADAEMLRIVFQNVLVNSAHAMQGRGRIRVAVNTIDSACHIAFTDQGPGIPVEIRDKIFSPFFYDQVPRIRAWAPYGEAADRGARGRDFDRLPDDRRHDGPRSTSTAAGVKAWQRDAPVARNPEWASSGFSFRPT
jgi:hypothetical protein